MIAIKRWLLSILLAGFLTMTIMAATGAYQNGIEVEHAKGATLGTLICKRVGEDTWAGTAKLMRPYGLAHGTTLVQPVGNPDPWKAVTVKGSFMFGGGKESDEFERTGDFWATGNRNEFFLSHPTKQAPILSVEISGLREVWRDDELKLDVVNMLCGCESVLGVFLTIFALGTGLISVVLGFLTVRAFTHPKPAKVVQPR